MQLPKSLWAEALMHVVWLKKQTSTKALCQTTPHEPLTGMKPDLTETYEWGQRCGFMMGQTLNSTAEPRWLIVLDLTLKAGHTTHTGLIGLRSVWNAKYDSSATKY